VAVAFVSGGAGGGGGVSILNHSRDAEVLCFPDYPETLPEADGRKPQLHHDRFLSNQYQSTSSSNHSHTEANTLEILTVSYHRPQKYFITTFNSINHLKPSGNFTYHQV
jgi:hypothetical protein